MKKIAEIFKENLKAEMIRQGLVHGPQRKLDYAALAKRAGLTRSGTYKIVEGHRWPNPDNIDRIHAALKLSPGALFGGPASRPDAKEALEVLAQAIGTKAPEIPKPVREATLLDDPWLKEVARIPKHLRYHLAPGLAAVQDVMKESDRNENDQGKKPQG